MSTAKEITHKDIIIGNKLYKVRRSRGLTRSRVAKHLKVTHQQIQKYENGINRITASRLHDFCELTGTHIADYFYSSNTLPIPPIKGRSLLSLMHYAGYLDPDTLQKFTSLVKAFTNKQVDL